MQGTSSPASQQLSRGNLLNLFGVALNATTVARIFSGVRLNWIKIYGLPASTSQYSTVSVEWTSDNGPTSVKSDTGNYIEPPMIHTSPPANSRAAFWSKTGNAESEILAIITSSVGHICDINFTAVFQNGETPVSTTGFTGLGVGVFGADTPANLGDAVSYVNL